MMSVAPADSTETASGATAAPAKERVSDFAFYERSDSRAIFSWGAEAGANIDLTGNDMSTVAINLSTGLRWRWIRFIGIGAEADITVSNSNRFFPIGAVFFRCRLSFSGNAGKDYNVG